MIEEPYRWVEAIANRREYIETQLAPGSPIAALSFRDGILFRDGRPRACKKLFRDLRSDHAAGADWASGRHRAAADGGDRIGEHGRFHAFGGRCVVAAAGFLFAQPAFEDGLRASLRRAVSGADDFCRSGRDAGRRFVFARGIRWRDHGQRLSAADTHPPRFSVISGSARSAELMEALLRRDHDPACTLNAAMKLALDAWSAGSLPLPDNETKEIPSPEALLKHRQEKLTSAAV